MPALLILPLKWPHECIHVINKLIFEFAVAKQLAQQLHVSADGLTLRLPNLNFKFAWSDTIHFEND